MQTLTLTDEELDMLEQALKVLTFKTKVPPQYQRHVLSAHRKVREARKKAA